MLIHFKFGDVRFNIQPLAACKAHLWTFATSRTNSNSDSQFSCDVSSMKSLIKHPRLVIWKGVTRKKAPKDTLQLLRRCLEQSHLIGFRVTSLPQPIGKTSKTPSIAEEWGQILSNLGERNSAYKKYELKRAFSWNWREIGVKFLAKYRHVSGMWSALPKYRMLEFKEPPDMVKIGGQRWSRRVFNWWILIWNGATLTPIGPPFRFQKR